MVYEAHEKNCYQIGYINSLAKSLCDEIWHVMPERKEVIFIRHKCFWHAPRDVRMGLKISGTKMMIKIVGISCSIFVTEITNGFVAAY
jgi:hypothetical protein